jgi:tetratricopeptide (TPR) repeat protein
VISAVSLILQGKAKLSHAILFIFGCVLLAHGDRFSVECTILAVPITAEFARENLARGALRRLPQLAWSTVLLLVLPFIILAGLFSQGFEYPFHRLVLPYGTVEFLNRINTGGKVLNDPDVGGYLHWALNPDYKIYGDMQLAIMDFNDIAFVRAAFQDVVALQNIVNKYNPDYIFVMITNQHICTDIEKKLPQYRLVFFDDRSLLYVNSLQFPEIAERYSLKGSITLPMTEIMSYNRKNPEQLRTVLADSRKVLEVDPFLLKANLISCIASNALGEREQALKSADLLATRYKNDAVGYAMKGKIFLDLNRPSEAVHQLETALRKSGDSYRLLTSEWLYLAYSRVDNNKKAYEILRTLVNPLQPTTDYRDILSLGFAAAAAGENDDAVVFLKLAEQKLPPQETETRKKIESYLIQQGQTESD